MQTNILDEIYTQYLSNYIPSYLDDLVKEINCAIITRLKLFISLNYDKSIEDFINSLSSQDKRVFLCSKIPVFLKVKTINGLINETISNEAEYDSKILKYLAEVKLGENGKGVPTKQILTHIGGNATILRTRLLALKEKNLVYGLGRTKSKTWVLDSFKTEAKINLNKELGIFK